VDRAKQDDGRGSIRLPAFEKPPKQRLAVAIAEELKQMIRTGELQPGDKLPNESTLCEHFGVSRITIREAVQILRTFGLLEPTRGRGTFVRQPDAEAFFQDLAYFAFDHAGSVADLFEVRSLLECHAARRAATQAPPEQRPELLQIVEGMRTILDADGPLDTTKLGDLDTEFHLRIARIGGNLVLEHLLKRVMQILEAVRVRSLNMPGQPQASWEHHRQIAEAIIQGSTDLAVARVVEHMESVKAAIINSELPGNGRTVDDAEETEPTIAQP
jgi:GntR family transcriptional regulator, transcriptional repressor for pyruvate dehydrogenase complex